VGATSAMTDIKVTVIRARNLAAGGMMIKFIDDTGQKKEKCIFLTFFLLLFFFCFR
jgi:hypothetical protein